MIEIFLLWAPGIVLAFLIGAITAWLINGKEY